MKVIFLKNNQIDKEKWNKSLSKCINPYTYAYSWYLDTVCQNWDAIIADDYSILIPLPNYGKLFFTIYQPPLTPKLGIFYSSNLSKTYQDIFINDLPSNYKNFKLTFNKYNTLRNNKNITKKYFYSLDLYNSYNKHLERYSTHLQSIINDTKNKEYYIINGLATNEIIAFLNKAKYFDNNNDYDTLRRVLSLTSLRKLSSIYAVFSNQNELVGIGIFVLSSFTADLLVIKAKEDNEKIISFLIDKFIKTNSGKGITLNFECNNEENLTKNYSEFGASKQYLEQLTFTKLPRFFQFFNKNK